MKPTIAIEWKNGTRRGQVEVACGRLATLSADKGKATVAGNTFAFSSDGACRLRIALAEAKTSPGSDATIITVRTAESPFSFFLRDVTRTNPILMPILGVVVTEAGDNRSFDEIEQTIRARGLQTCIQRIESEPEENFDDAAAHTRDMKCETWLGLSRDMRIFAMHFRSKEHRWDWIQPRFHGMDVKSPETSGKPDNSPNFLKYGFMMGRGMGCTDDLSRQLEDGVLPILHATLAEEDIRYNLIAFATLEKQPLVARNVRGTHFLVADGHGHGHMFTEEQKKQYDALLPKEMEQEEETVLCVQVKAVNTGKVPRYAWYYAPALQLSQYGLPKDQIDEDGFAAFESGRVLCVNRLNGEPLRQREIAVLVPPGEAAVFEFFIPHRPVSNERAAKIGKFDFFEKHAECAAYWRQKLGHGARVCLPEQRLDEMARAGLLHLDLVAYGLENAAANASSMKSDPRSHDRGHGSNALAACIGWYNPIGSESSPIIQFFDSMGWHDVAERALQYFLDKQHDDGFIQNFGGYMLETGAALWSMGEHWRYTRDAAWLKRVAPKLLKSCDYIIRWRERNKRPELRGKGYGMIDGKVGDPEDPYHIFMLNGYAYLGLARVAEALTTVNRGESRRLAREAAAMRTDIRASLFEAVAKAPVVPLGDGTWCPTAPPWAEDERGPLCLYAQKGQWYSHGTFFCRDSMIGSPYLALQEILDPNERVMDWMMAYHADLMTDRNVGFSQPYYCRHDWTHLKRGEVKAFLKTYYNAFAGLADRETYTFWEHYFGASPHKTHEEAWFLMQTRWMLWMEEGDTLRLLPGVPRAWLEHGKTIELEKVASYFGPISLRVESKLQQGVIEASVECRSNRQPKKIKLRLPHPQGAKARKVIGGVYCAGDETVCVEQFCNSARIKLTF